MVAHLLVAALYLNGFEAAASAKANLSDFRQIDSLTVRVLQKEVQFVELNTRVQRQTIPRSSWTGRRWFLYQVTNTSLTAAGALLSGAGRFSYLHRGRIGHAPPDYFEHAGWLRVGANIDSVAGSLLEIALDRVADAKDRRNGIDLPTLDRRYSSLLAEVDQLLEQRERAITSADLSPSSLAAYSRQSLVLKDLRDVADSQFQSFFRDARAWRAKLAVQHGFSLAANAVSGACSYAGSIYALQQKRVTGRWRTRLGTASGIGDVIGGSINALAPFAISAAGRLVHPLAAADARRVAQLTSTLQEDGKRYAELARAGTTEGNVQQVIDVLSHVVVSEAEMSVAFKQGQNFRSGERLAINTMTGGAKITNGIGGLIGSLQDTANPEQRFKVFGATNMVYGCAYSVATVDLLRIQLALELNLAKERRNHLTPYQLLDQQMESLAALESKLH